ncbi:MAG: ATP phosphoribosyltransferase regulatory subunit [Acidaminococcaceae bacterium]|nr:ATP phosphoribosyltransferase regulatory subunit [Acidaminococcaceae bacterium]MDD4722704.1 ATP phosphoribosyltransferase regulatory subunit [Acidaminococcaceae bacterium]
MTKSKVLQIPYGTKDILPGEARAKRRMEDKIAANFLSWGYDEVATPTFEYLDTFSIGNGGVSEESMKFLDRNNRTLVLRSDMTTPLARLVATRLNAEKSLKRLFYIANIFRYEETQAGRQCEFCQAGVELMGAAEPTADAEVLALAIASLQAAGLVDFTLSLGHIDFLAGLMEEAQLNENEAETIKKAVLEHNAVGLEQVIKQLNLAPELQDIFNRLLFLHGGEELIASLLKTVKNAKSRAALHNLAAIYKLTKEYGVAKFISLDLSLNRNLDYYTGMVFEVYTENMGFNICGGGRYDKMMQSFGQDCPATGFAMGINRIMLVLERQHKLSISSEWDVFVAWKQTKLEGAIKRATELRTQGKTVKMSMTETTEKQAMELQRLNRCNSLVYIK